VKKTLGNGKLIGDDLTKQNYRYIAKQGKADETLLAVKPKDPRTGKGKVVWLQKGDSETGWKHIKSRHIKGTNNIDDKDATSFFPVGQTVKGTKLPDTMSKKEVENMIYDAIKNGEATQVGERTRYYFQPIKHGYPNSGVNALRVIVLPNGKVKTAFPLDGPAVKKWISQANGGRGKFVDA
jgi:hypothetical protein